MNLNENKGILFDKEMMIKVRERFYHMDEDPLTGESRVFLDNAGGALRLKSTNDVFQKLDAMPDCPEHSNKSALILNQIQEKGFDDIKTVFNATSGSILTSLTASMVMFDIARAIIENVPGTNVVTTKLEHPSAFDSVAMYAEKMGKELRVAETNPVTGGVDMETIVNLIDENTCVLSVIYASNISGAILNIEEIVKAARAVKPDLYIICDAVQHAPHGVLDLVKTPVDAMNFAPYKFSCPRGIGFGYVSDRVAELPHNKLIAKDASEWELGSPAPAHFAAFSAYVNYVCWIGDRYSNATDRRELFVEGMNRIKLHERALMDAILCGTDNCVGLRNIKGVTVHLDMDDLTDRDLILAVEFDGIPNQEAVKLLENEGIIAFERVISSAYSVRMLELLGFNGCVRVSPLHCHNIEDVEKFLNAVAKIAGRN